MALSEFRKKLVRELLFARGVVADAQTVLSKARTDAQSVEVVVFGFSLGFWHGDTVKVEFLPQKDRLDLTPDKSFLMIIDRLEGWSNDLEPNKVVGRKIKANDMPSKLNTNVYLGSDWGFTPKFTVVERGAFGKAMLALEKKATI